MPDKKYFQRAANMGQYILNEGNKNGCWLEDRLKDSIECGPNPYYSVIPDDGSLLLEMFEGMPRNFHTPLGKFHFSGSGSGDHRKLMDDLKIKFGLIEIVPEKKTKFQCFGPIYAVTRDLEGSAFPMPSEPRHKITLDYGTANTVWDEIKPTIDVAKDKDIEPHFTLS